ncbi:RING zinc finger protein-like protein [Periconia macrospinosa]|uniref:E3 ubiquitin-protein ligase listerin n=1 Tax=Periconia macrospinosa TaxID=97972 RepID=A0A2V1DTX3_9PLEO|nr:RING zinc finger protein-like protein [Periconia macrospinosa]
MSKKLSKAQASAARAASTALGAGFGTSSAFTTSSSQLSYVTEPPDLSSISDPNVVVYFRNLSKKDSTTKSKALEDLQAHVASLKNPVEEGLLEAWIKMYPRTSIDNAKSVRQSAHALHGQLAVAAGKRIAKYMPQAVGAWLSGLYDSDRSVVDATQSSLRLVFNTPEKIQNIRKAYQHPILEYCRDAIDKESQATLSDERTVSPDDAEAKYSRVISACISLLGSLLANLQPEDLAKYQSDYDGLLADKKLWEFASHKDASIRRSTHRFLRTCLAKQPNAVQQNLEAVSKAYLSVALNSDQMASAYDYIDTIALLTKAFPTVWTEHYKSKTAADRRLRQFLKKGSQLGPRDFWVRLADLFNDIPQEVLPVNAADAAELLNSLHGGISRKDESRVNLEAAFKTYLQVTGSISKLLSVQDQSKLLAEMVLPIIAQYLRPSPENTQWNIPQQSHEILVAAVSMEPMSTILKDRWPEYTQKLVNDIKTSAPEQSKDYERSHDSLIKQAARFATLQDLILKTAKDPALCSAVTSACSSVLSEALDVTRNRNGKPYGAAGAVAEFLHHNQDVILEDEQMKLQLDSFLQQDLSNLIFSPSSSYLVDVLYSLPSSPSFKSAWTTALKTVLKAPESTTRSKALEAILTSSRIPKSFEMASEDPELQQFIKINVRGAIEGLKEWDSFHRILQSPAKILSADTTNDILSKITESIVSPQNAPYALQGLRQIVRQNPPMLKEFLSTSQGSDLLRTLLLASEFPNEEVALGAAAVSASIQTLLAANTETKQSMYDLIQQGLATASVTSVSVETLVELANQLVQTRDSWEQVAGVFPSPEVWTTALEPFLDTAPKTSLAIANPLTGAVYLVESKEGTLSDANKSRDGDGYSAAYRITQYVVKLFKDKDFFSFEKVPSDLQGVYLRNIALTIQLADDNIGLAGANGLWSSYNPDVEADAIAFMSDAQPFLTQELKRLGHSWSKDDSELLTWTTGILEKVEPNVSPRAYYSARTYSVLVGDAIEATGWKASLTPQVQELLKSIRRSKEIFPIIAFLNAFKEPLAASKSCERMCNEIVAGLTGLDLEKKPAEGLQQLVLLNILLFGQEDLVHSIAKQRLIFFVKHVIPWLEDSNNSIPIRAEVARVLTALLPSMSDMYGEHWGQILTSLAESWAATREFEKNELGIDNPIPFVHASLKLFAQLRALTQSEDPNDDLLDVWKENEQAVATGLVNLLKHSQHFPDEFHQPLKMVNDVLARQIAKIPLQHLESTEDLFPLLYVESQPVQQTAFDILHKQIPAAQEQISIDSALEKTTARLPDELLSLILEAPTVASLAEVNFDRSVPLPLKGYLLSWILVFDHLEHASFKVKNDYIDHIKEGEYLGGLLDFMFDFLGHAHNKPTDVSKLDITSYTPDTELPKRDIQWLLTHLYYLCLLHIPSLTKSWYIDCKSRPIAVTLEPWTEKFISPPVIAAALTSVQDWASSQTTTDPDSPFTIKVSPRAQEITASYTIDEQTTSMRISLPAAFPLTNARIEGLERLAVNEAKWQSWLRTSLGAITIFNGSLIDALTTFKRNVEGAIKGQTECAICYSVVGSDRKLPDKKCGTCRNSFHGGCLFKWFKSSGSSSCPLCRNPFNYG